MFSWKLKSGKQQLQQEQQKTLARVELGIVTRQIRIYARPSGFA